MRESYRWEELCCCAEMPELFLMGTPFFMGTESPCTPNCPKGLCIWQKHANQLEQCLPGGHTLLLCLLLFFCLCRQFPKSPFAMLEWPRASLPAQILGYNPTSSTAAATLNGEQQNPCRPGQIWGAGEALPGEEQKLQGDRAGLLCQHHSTDNFPNSWWPGTYQWGWRHLSSPQPISHSEGPTDFIILWNIRHYIAGMDLTDSDRAEVPFISICVIFSISLLIENWCFLHIHQGYF